MPIINKIQGNLLELAKQGKFTAIAHGCNTFGTFGAGIALQIAREFPEAYQADQIAYENDTNKLGTYSVAYSNNVLVFNLYTQDTVGWNKIHNAPPVDYTAIYRAFLKLNTVPILNKPNSILAIPSLIGCGLAKGEPTIVRSLINLATPNIDIILVEYKQ